MHDRTVCFLQIDHRHGMERIGADENVRRVQRAVIPALRMQSPHDSSHSTQNELRPFGMAVQSFVQGQRTFNPGDHQSRNVALIREFNDLGHRKPERTKRTQCPVFT